MAEITACPPLTRPSVQEAAARIKGKVHRTPILSSTFIDSVASAARTEEQLQGTPWYGQNPARPRLHIMFKCENFQKIGAFKPRGAFNAVLRCQEERQKDTGEYDANLPVRIISHSSGNHAQAVALAAKELGFPAHIVMPAKSMPTKIAATRGYGATIHFSGPTPQERLVVVEALMQEAGFENVFIPPYDHPDTLLGQGTLGLEIQEQMAEVLSSSQRLDAIMTPCGGGGMLSGTALSCHGTSIRVFGAEPSFEGADDCCRGIEAGRRIESVKSTTIADGLRTPVGGIPWSVISDPAYVQGVFSVSEHQIRDALEMILQRMKIIIEPSSAVPLAAALYNEDFRHLVEEQCEETGDTFNLVVVVSGGNVDVRKLPDLLNPQCQ